MIAMDSLHREIRHNPLLWLLAFRPVLFAAQKPEREARTLLFVLSVPAIVSLAALLIHATESVTTRTGFWSVASATPRLGQLILLKQTRK